jgi:tetratricopeptide (TPR) repeat protein
MTVNILPGEPEVFSLFGEPLYRAPMRAEIYEAQKARYDEAYENYVKDPEDADNIIWLGRRTAYLGRYREACAIFSIGAKKHPDDPRFPRHRGHRFITMRMFHRAIEDFERAEELMDSSANEIEPDGIPNDRNQPVSSLQTNVWYHLGLGYYLIGEYEKAERAYEKGIKVWDIPDNYASFANWYYQTLRFLGKDEEAKALIEKASPDMDLIENGMYLNLLLVFKGEMPVEELEKEMRSSGELGLVTLGYGIAAWYLINDEKEKATDLLKEIVSIKGWAGFGYIAAEVMYKRMGYSI